MGGNNLIPLGQWVSWNHKYGYPIVVSRRGQSNLDHDIHGASCECGWSASVFREDPAACYEDYLDHLFDGTDGRVRVTGTIICSYGYDFEVDKDEAMGRTPEDLLEDYYSEGEMGIIEDHEVKDAQYVVEDYSKVSKEVE